MRKMIVKPLVFGMMLGIGLIPANAHTYKTLDSGSATLKFSGTGIRNLRANLWNCDLTGCSFSSSASGLIASNSATSRSQLLTGPFTLTNDGSETFFAPATGLDGSSPMVTSSIESSGPEWSNPVGGQKKGCNDSSDSCVGQEHSSTLAGPASTFLFGSALMLLGGILRRRKVTTGQAQPSVARAVMPLFANQA